jgi:hypothetical protein
MTSTTDSISLEILEGPEYRVEEDDNHWQHNAYKVRLTYQGRTMTVPWRQGLGIEREPNAEDVMEALLSDAAGFDNARSFEDWAEEYGYDTDSRKAEKLYRAVKAQTDKLARLLGDDFERMVFPPIDTDES